MALAKKCDRCGKYHNHYPKGKKSQFNSIRRLQKDERGNIDDWNDKDTDV